MKLLRTSATGSAGIRGCFVLILLLLTSCGGPAPSPPNLQTEFERLTKILDTTIKDFEIEVTRTTDLKSPECTTMVGWVNTGKYRLSRHLEGKLPAEPDLRTLVQRIGGRWRAENFVVTFFESRDSSVISVTGRDDRRGELYFSALTAKNTASISVETICLKP